jgi:hypothetical protein
MVYCYLWTFFGGGRGYPPLMAVIGAVSRSHNLIIKL